MHDELTSVRCAPVTRRLLLPLLLLTGCAHRFPAQYGLDELRADSEKWPGDALIHYLSRPGPDVEAACDAANFTRVDSSLVGPFVAGIDNAAVPINRWLPCAQKLLPTLPEAQRVAFVEELAKRVPDFVDGGELQRLRVAYLLFSERPRDPAPALGKLAAKDMPSAIPEIRAQVDELRALIELEAATLNGAPLTVEAIAKLEDEALLRRIGARAPDEALRIASRRTIVRLHIAASPLREVKERAAEVEAAVFAHGRWAQPVESLAAPAPQPALVLPVDVRFSQDISAQLAAPFLANDERKRAPAIDLRPFLRFHVGWSEPLALCEPAEALSVLPCVDARELQVGTGFASLDASGTLRLIPKWAMADAIDLSRAGLGLVVPVLLGDRPTQVLQVPLTAQPPSSFCFQAASTNHGPRVNAMVVPVTQGLLVEAVDDRNQRVQFVLPRGAAGFEFGSCGGDGVPGTAGARGANGAAGTPGSSASCPGAAGGRGGNGGNGYPGGRGGDGGPGGDGGAVRVELRCGNNCDDELLVRSVFHSRGGRGGAGGAGGPGGSGGPGGAGGASTSCYQNGKTNFVSGGSQGSRGSDGPRGADGMPGVDGHDGPVEVILR